MSGASSALLLLLCLAAVASTDAAKVLLFPFGSCLNSHLLNMEKLATILTDSGHQVSMLINSKYRLFGHHPQTLPNDTFDDVTANLSAASSLDGSIRLYEFQAPPDFTPICEYDSITWMMTTPIAKRFDGLIHTLVNFCDAILMDKHLLWLLKQEKFDLFIPDSLDPCSRILADYLDIPFMPLLTTGLGHFDGNPRPPSYVPSAISNFTPTMSFMQRFVNTIQKFMYDIIPVMIGIDSHFDKLKQIHNLNTSISLADTFNRAALKLVNSDFAIDYPSPIEPDTILIGGFAVDKPKPLEPALQKFIDESGDAGVIVFSFGTLVKRFDSDWTKLFADAFAQIPQRVIWRYHDDQDLAHNSTHLLSDNILLMRWVPQVDILAHPKTKLLITHCGLNSAMEASTYGVPVVAVPMSGDQFNIASKLTSYANMGVQLDVHSLTTENFLDAVKTVLGDPKFKANAVSVSERMLDQPHSPKDIITYWVDYVLRHKGAPHLKSVAHKLTWYQYLSLDVIGSMLLIAAVLVYVLLSLAFILLRKMLKSLYRRLAPVFHSFYKTKLC